MSKVWLGVMVGAVSYIIFMAMQAPASWVIQRAQQQLPGLAISGVTGSLWRGQASQVNYQDQQIDKASWALNPLTLLQGCLGYHVKGQWQGQPVSLNAGSQWNKQPCISAVKGSLDLSILLASGNLPVQVSGIVEVDIDTVSFAQGGQLPLFSGRLHWPEANIISPLELDLGSVSLQLDPDGNTMMRGELTAQGGQLTIDAPVDITPEGDFSINMAIRFDGEPSEEIQAGLGAFAEFHDGVYQLEYSDNIYSILQ